MAFVLTSVAQMTYVLGTVIPPANAVWSYPTSESAVPLIIMTEMGRDGLHSCCDMVNVLAAGTAAAKMSAALQASICVIVPPLGNPWE
jgi:hypothetical protein